MLRIFTIGCCVIMFAQPAAADTLTRSLGRAMVMGAGAAVGSMAVRGAVEYAKRPSASPTAQTGGQQQAVPQRTGETQNPFSRP